jgi:hypothetical protein
MLVKFIIKTAANAVKLIKINSFALSTSCLKTKFTANVRLAQAQLSAWTADTKHRKLRVGAGTSVQ